MKDELISRNAVMKALTKEYNERFREGNGLQLAYIEKAVNSVCGWIPVESEIFPENSDFILLSFENFSVPQVGRFENNNFYAGDEDEPLLKHGVFVNVWMPLPERYEG